MSELTCQIIKASFLFPYIIIMSIEEQDFRQILSRTLLESQELYTLQQFISQIQRLTQISILFYCPYNLDSLAQFYYKICEEMKLSLMNLRSIQSFIQALRNQNSKIIKNQLHYYQSQFNKKMNDSLLIISKKELKRIIDRAMGKFINDRLDYQIITDILIEKSNKPEFFSCVKVLDLLKQIDNEINQYNQPSLSPQKLIKDQRISTDECKMQQQAQVDQITMALINDPKYRLQNYFDFWHKKIVLFVQFITDIEIRQQAEGLSESLKRQQNDLLEDISYIANKFNQSQAKCLEYQQFMKRSNQQKQLYEEMFAEQKNQINELKIKLGQVQNEKKGVQKEALLMEKQIQQGSSELIKLQNYLHQIEEELRNQRERYIQLYNQYEKITKQFNVQQQIAKKDKIFQERTLKQKLDDTLHRFNRLLKQRQSQKKTIAEKQQQHEIKIQILQAKIEELEAQMRSKKEDLRDYFANSKIMNGKMSLFNKSVIFDRQDSVTVRGSVFMSSGIKSEIIVQDIANLEVKLPPSRISARLGQELFNKATNKSNLEKKSIAAQNLPQIQQENGNALDSSHLPSQQQLTKVIQSDNSSIALQDTNKGFQKKKALVKVEQASTIPSRLDEAILPENFFAKGVFINVLGVKYEVNILLTHKRFCYFDMKLRLVRYLPFQNIKSFVFCKENSTLFLLRPKNTHELDRKNHIIYPMIFSIRSRQRFANHLTTKINKLVKENKIQLVNKLEDDIFLKIEDQQINMKHKIANMNNPYRIALSDQPVFYVKLQEQGILTFRANVIIVIQPMGLVCFKGDQAQQLEVKQQYLYYFPLNNCILSQRQNSKEAPGRKLKLIYQNQIQKYFNLLFNSKEDLKLFMKACQEQKAKSKNSKGEINQSLDMQFKKCLIT